MTDIDRIVELAEVIIGGYVILPSENGNYCVVNINREGHACVFSKTYEIIESSMDEIESEIALDQLVKAQKYKALSRTTTKKTSQWYQTLNEFYQAS